MLPKTEIVKNCNLKFELEPLERPVFLRFKFSKIGKLKFISHLDLQRTFNRAIIRAGIPAWYTQGFNPHTKLVFATPLSVGAGSVCEYLDVKTDRKILPEDAMQRLNAELSDELFITDAYFPKTSFSGIIWSEYEIKIYSDNGHGDAADKINALFGRPEIMMMKRSKAGDREVNIIPYINRLEAKKGEDITVISTVLSANSQSYLNPELIIGAIKRETDIFPDESAEALYSVMRTAVLTQDGKTLFR